MQNSSQLRWWLLLRLPQTALVPSTLMVLRLTPNEKRPTLQKHGDHRPGHCAQNVTGKHVQRTKRNRGNPLINASEFQPTVERRRAAAVVCSTNFGWAAHISIRTRNRPVPISLDQLPVRSTVRVMPSFAKLRIAHDRRQGRSVAELGIGHDSRLRLCTGSSELRIGMNSSLGVN